MKKIMLAGVLLGSVLASNAQATLLTFDDVGVQNHWNTVLPSPYQGYVIGGELGAIDLVGSPWSWGAHSGEFGGYLYGSSVSFLAVKSDNSDFTFNGLWAMNTISTGTIKGYNNGVNVFTINTGASSAFQYVAGQSTIIDQLIVSLGGSAIYDDISLGDIVIAPPVVVPPLSPGVVNIPEPSVLGLLVAGLLLLVTSTRSGDRRTPSWPT